ncbi:polysaccharide biosynthesis/export family protein [Novosphingobium sp. TH158]|uniref:polysaccharide biosynthesis/export family protein n=1 Tax=Novosphingobium sp. TH158 TaxID=2067455 RepID=UPI0013040085|nr:polysaccharide biosynthesis/export family protein [Novosphingobium sp. TH158]
MLAALLGLAMLSACASAGGPSPLPQGAAAYETIPERVDNGELSERIRPGDRLGIRIFGEPELSSDNYRVDAVGYLQMPLIGEMPVGGQTPRELRAEITRRLAARFIKDPQVAITVLDRPRSTFTVEGDVESPGVFEANPGTTLLTALAQAKSPTKTAKLSEIMVFRIINGQRAGGRFNLSDIRRGRAPDPQILAGDTIVVGNSAVKSTWRDFLAAAPLFNIFTFF